MSQPQTNPKNQDETAPRKPRVHSIPTCPPGFFPEAELSRRHGEHIITTRLKRARGDCPPFVPIGKTIFYSEAAYAKWLAAKMVDPSKPKKLTRRRRA